MGVSWFWREEGERGGEERGRERKYKGMVVGC